VRTTSETLILVPGLGADARMWAPQVAALRDRAAIMVADDAMRGDSIPVIAAAILAAAPRRFALAGASMGGYVALEVVRQAPARVARLALLNTAARADGPEQKAAREALIAIALRDGVDAAVAERLPLTVHAARRSDAAFIRLFYEMQRDAGVAQYVRQMRAAMGRVDSRPLLPAIACPTLIVAGREDALLPLALSEEMAAAIPGARLVVIDDCGHCANLEHPAAVNAALADWLA
jgi:pimeloyl-ACP methyl ester carboxylesterase